MAAYYNEHDPKMAAWLRALIAARLIADGDVDGRSIVDVRPGDLADYTQCHFFAGIGGWSYALRLAGWNDDRPVWTGSCPCQPFSAAGKGDGTADPRHLWPAWFELIRECRPAIVFGEQVASADGLGWLDRVCHDLEGEDYAVGAADLCAPCVGAFDIRQRLWFVAQSTGDGRRGWSDGDSPRNSGALQIAGRGGAGQLADTWRGGCYEQRGQRSSEEGAWERRHQPDDSSNAGELGDPGSEGLQRREQRDPCHGDGHRAEAYGSISQPGRPLLWADNTSMDQVSLLRGIPVHDPPDARVRMPMSADRGVGDRSLCDAWRNAEWIPCTDGKWRPVEPGTQQMVDGLSRAVGRLRDFCAQERQAIDVASGGRFRDEVVQALRDCVRPTEIWQAVGRRIGFPASLILLANLCEHERELGSIFYGAASQGPEGRKDGMRTVWQGRTATCPSSRWQLSEQLAGELGDIVSALSQTGASLAGFTGGPLAHGVPARVGRLRGYGNAIKPQVAALFIRAYRDVVE